MQFVKYITFVQTYFNISDEFIECNYGALMLSDISNFLDSNFYLNVK